MTLNPLSRFILWLRKLFHIRLEPKHKKEPPEEKPGKVLLPEEVPPPEENPLEVTPLPEERPPEIPSEKPVEAKPPEGKTPEVPRENIIETESQIGHPEEEAKTKTRKPYKKKTPIEEREKEHRKPSEDEKKPGKPKLREEIDLGRTKGKKPRPAKQPAGGSIERTGKASEGKETPTRVESPFVEIDLDEARAFLVLPKQQFKPSTVSNIPQQLNYKLEVNGEEQILTMKIIEDNQGFAKVGERRIELEKPLKNFQVVFPEELQGRPYSYTHNTKNLYAFAAIGNNRGRMYYLYDKDGTINSLPNRMVWLLLHEDFKLEIESNYLTEETWIWDKYRPFRVNLKEMNELAIKNTKTSKEYKLSCEPTFSIEGQVIEDDFKNQIPLLIGETLKIKAPRENPSRWIVWIQNKQAGYRIIDDSWVGVEALELKLPGDLPCECGEFQVDICEQDDRIPIETLFFRYIPSLQLEFPRDLIIPDPNIGHKQEIIEIFLERDFQDWELKLNEKVKRRRIENGYQVEQLPEQDILRFSLMKKGKPETEIKFQITIPRLKWKTSKHEAWNGKLQNIKRDELIYGESFYLLICTNDFNNKYDLSAILETNGQRLQEGKFIQQGINYNLELNQFYDTIKQNKGALALKIEIRGTKDYKLLGTPEILCFDAKGVIQKPLPPKIVSYDLINTLSLPKVCFVLRRIKTVYPKEKLACKEVLQLYYQEIKTKKGTKRDISMYKRAFVIRSLALIKFIIDTCGDKTLIKGQKKWKRRIASLQQTYPEEFKNTLDGLIRGDKHAH